MGNLYSYFTSYFTGKMQYIEPGTTRVLETHFKDGTLRTRQYQIYKTYSIKGEWKLHREDGAAFEEHWEDGSVQYKWFRNGKLHNELGPAVERYHSNSVCARREWWHKGQLHNKIGPALEVWWSNGNLLEQCYYKNGKLHNKIGFASEYRYYDEQIYERKYRINGILHRDDGPALEYWDSNGNLRKREWYQNGNYCNDGTAPIIEHWNNGVKTLEIWGEYYEYGTLNYALNTRFYYHREDGPAYIRWDDTGKLIKKEFYIKGEIQEPFVLTKGIRN